MNGFIKSGKETNLFNQQTTTPEGLPSDYPQFGWAVDGSCRGNGDMQYKIVDLFDRKTVIYESPVYTGGTNNIAEFLGIVHAIALIKKKGYEAFPVYSDSRTGRAWVRDRRTKSSIRWTPNNKNLYKVYKRALDWLEIARGDHAEVKTWYTNKWGEIPADFGRK